ncbi:MAG: hypoxanthine phosphoribosyltransferase [Clostridia bacterium]
MRIEDDVEQILIGEGELAERIRQLGQQITEDYEEKDLIVVGILKGASLFMSDLIRKIEGKISIDFMVVSSYGNASETSGVVRVIKDLDMDITDKRRILPLLVEDIIDTGLTLAYLKEYLCNRKAASVRICTLLDKPCRRSKPVEVEYIGFECASDEFIIGCGIDYAEKYRNLPYIASLKRGAYEK